MFLGPKQTNVALFGAVAKPEITPLCHIPPQSPRIEVEKTDNPLRVDLACGMRKKEGFIGIDIAKTDSTDIVHDLSQFPWPVESETVDEVYCCHYVEHTPNIIAFMEELWRILKPGGRAEIICPYYNSMRAWQDPTHTRIISEASFLYYNKGWRESEKLSHYSIKCDFDFSYAYAFYPDWANRSEEARAFAVKHYTNVVSDLSVHMTKKGSIKDLAK